MNKKIINIGIAERISESKWNEKFCDALDNKLKNGYEFLYSIINLDGSDWLHQIRPYDLIIWKSPWMGQLSFHYKEKIFFIKNHLGIEVIPNFETIWHFESKIAQNYIFKHYGIKTPNTFVTFDYSEALKFVENSNYPLIIKLSAGSGSHNVKMLKNKQQAVNELKKHFSKNIFWKIFYRYFDHQMLGSIYLQEFVPNNDSDLRITVIGDKYAFAFWRINRKNDFRASGSGKIDYQKEIPLQQIQFCMELSKKLNFDSMSYDIIFNKNEPLITEMSYGYSQQAIYNASGYYEESDDKKLLFKEGHYWPQYLWIEWIFKKFKIEKE